MGAPAAAEVSPLESRVFVGMVIADTLVSAGLVAYVQIYPANREALSPIWGAALFAGTVVYWVIRRREIRRRKERETLTL